MLDNIFDNLFDTYNEPKEYNLVQLFSTLDTRATHTSLRKSQEDALEALSNSHQEKDTILKLSTGSGKTTIGLLYLLGYMQLEKKPAVYLCPTVQLVEQVIEESQKLGIKTFPFRKSESELPADCYTGNRVIVCTYDKFFNAKSVFQKTTTGIIPEAIVLDDAHSGLELIRKQFTLILEDDIKDSIIEIVDADCRHYHQTKWADVKNSDPHTLFEIPYWIWQNHINQITETLINYKTLKNFIFVWPHIENILKYCRCVIKGEKLEIIPDIINIEKVKHYNNSNHRLFMSATLADDNILVRDLNISPSALKRIISPNNDKGIGERMILTPSLIDPSLTREIMIDFISQLSKKNKVVVLTPSYLQAKDWTDKGAELLDSDNIQSGIEKLAEPNSNFNFAVCSQRYEGVNLADETCRILVLDGIPVGSNTIDSLDAENLGLRGGVRNKIAYRIEQGMGRAVRSHADYAVVLLVGHDLGVNIAQHQVRASFSTQTVAQIDLSNNLCELIKKQSPQNILGGLENVIRSCLDRDEKWKNGYQQYMKKVEKRESLTDDNKVRLGTLERLMYVSAYNNQPTKYIMDFRQHLNNVKLDQEELGFYLEKASRILFSCDPSEALQLQIVAKEKYPHAFTPPNLPKKNKKPTSYNLINIVTLFKELVEHKHALIKLQQARGKLNFNNPNSYIIEDGIKELGSLLGLEASRPESEIGEGSDVVWLWDNYCYVIEIKHNNQKTLHKKDSGQLHDSVTWAKNYYTMFNIIPITITKDNVTNCDHDAHYDENTLLVQENHIIKLINNIENMYRYISEHPETLESNELLSKKINDYSLDRDSFRQNYSTNIKKNN